MKQHIAHIALRVHDYDEAISFYTQKLDFTILEDRKLTEEKRWLVLAPPGSKEATLLLSKATDEEQRSYVGKQSGGQVFLFLFTDDIWRDYQRMSGRGVHFIHKPKAEIYGTIAVFEDLYGNQWDIIEPTEKNKTFNRM